MGADQLLFEKAAKNAQKGKRTGHARIRGAVRDRPLKNVKVPRDAIDQEWLRTHPNDYDPSLITNVSLWSDGERAESNGQGYNGDEVVTGFDETSQASVFLTREDGAYDNQQVAASSNYDAETYGGYTSSYASDDDYDGQTYGAGSSSYAKDNTEEYDDGMECDGVAEYGTNDYVSKCESEREGATQERGERIGDTGID
ncbi:hypothetical protein EWM64_g4538 [Hericium alpestre]|uniref:Uncharacterized protein n=1 Tax=Hericium alpestre TaxID=135208 RepID=A0A4Y9ZZU9_9AGAM|nr:hypothetical protein EWM64_g4538 [Hericium alpestre]